MWLNQRVSDESAVFDSYNKLPTPTVIRVRLWLNKHAQMSRNLDRMHLLHAYILDTPYVRLEMVLQSVTHHLNKQEGENLRYNHSQRTEGSMKVAWRTELKKPATL